MLLHQLCAAPHVTIYYDAHNDWLFVEWEGHLTLPVVQYACVEVAHCYLEHAYPRVLNSNALVTGVDRDVETWLATNFLPNLRLAGVEQLAWVYSPALRGRIMAQHAVDQAQEKHVHVALFGDVDEAVAWLQHAHLSPAASAAGEAGLHPPAGGKLTHVVERFARYVKDQLAEEPVPQPIARPGEERRP